MEDTKLLMYVMFRELMVGGAGCVAGQEEESIGFLLDYLKLLVSTPTSGRLQPRTRENGPRRWNKGRNVSWRNESLERKPGLY